MKTPALLLAATFALALAPTFVTAADGFAWVEAGDDATDLTFDGRKVAQFVHPTLDTSSPEAREATYKPFHHVYDAEGAEVITKGPGGKYTHHRGIYFGFSKCRYQTPDGKEVTVDTWHCKGDAYQSHEETLEQTATSDSAVQVLRIDWHGAGGEVFATETRRLKFSMADDGALVVDFSSSVTPSNGVAEVTLDGDPQHAGFHFRASNEVHDATKGQTYYIRPGSGKDEPGKTINWSAKTDDETTRDLPWKAMSFVVGGERYTTVYLDHPDNPKPARFSERDYGRFGSYFVATATADQPVEVSYRLVIRKGEIEADAIEALSAAFVGE